MNEPKSLLLKRPVTLKVIVTQRWKDEAQQQLQAQIDQIEAQIQQLETQGQRAIAELQKQTTTPPNPETPQQIRSVQSQVERKQREAIERKNQALQQLQQVQLLELGKEVAQGQMDSFVRIESGDNLVRKMQVEIVIRDGVVEEIRGDA
ncbi:protein of unknown function (DUF2869) [Rubidibacter lacunae KORDI 51-2]|uniref:YlqD protein n=1 Tax=Rubidibacter lacunae KORDI 51-2 TaxID=582515 RepID=U5DJ98_9CHRO|nr:YlqD family protein [Rubidibacter lacunae]ERN41007.1 protein of unknown function (DUF2869) [Rubidibacter lacunae KORDI 51-2]